jgi:hypothetical protein
MKIQPKKRGSNLSAERSTLNPMTPAFLYNFPTLLQSRNQNYTSKKFDIHSPNVKSRNSTDLSKFILGSLREKNCPFNQLFF